MLNVKHVFDDGFTLPASIWTCVCVCVSDLCIGLITCSMIETLHVSSNT